MSFGIYQSYIRQPEKFFAPSVPYKVGKYKSPRRNFKSPEVYSSHAAPVTITNFSNKSLITSRLSSRASPRYSTEMDWSRDNRKLDNRRKTSMDFQKNDSLYMNSYSECSNLCLNKVNLSLEEPAIKRPTTKSVRRSTESENVFSNQKEIIRESYAYLRPKSMKYTQYLKGHEVSERKYPKSSRSYSVRRDERGQTEQNHKRPRIENLEKYTSEKVRNVRSTRYECFSPGLYQSAIISNYLLELQ
ncbi:unnamed protein product [Blepharisma stoltei]|uniref:Uncharacterized protein n=1 Tax=Blepharisma stoltei TaxID=1481888 RepID=A0AAU9ILT4_9CILI|nr:unnamed protein product [Blepharisma stoltei]